MKRAFQRIIAFARALFRPWVGMQSKSVLVLAVVVLVITTAGGWSYYAVLHGWVAESRRCHVNVLAESLARSSQNALSDGDVDFLKQLARDFVRTEGVRRVLIVDADGRAVAQASAPGIDGWPNLAAVAVSVSETRQLGESLFAIVRPVVDVPESDRKRQLVGSVRMVVDTTPLAASLAEVRGTMLLIAALLIGAGMPLGYLLVWRVLVQPVRKLVSTTARLAEGDYSARVGMRRGDEIGELAESFDAMAEEIARSREALLRSNELLERKVRLRTEKLHLANRRLVQEITEKEDFLRAVSHDLNAPLRNVSGLVQAVLRRWSHEIPSDAATRLERVRANVNLAGDMLEDLLELSRVKTRPQRREPTDMYELVREVADSFEFDVSARGIEIEIADNMPTLLIEKRRLRQALQNLIDNAVKYMHREKGGRIEVGYRLCEGRYEFSVSDNGPGLSKDQQQEVFCVFRRAANPITARVEGKGVGLALVKAIAANHNGDAWVESVEGEGSTFYLSLSVEQADSGGEGGTVDRSFRKLGEPVPADAEADFDGRGRV